MLTKFKKKVQQIFTSQANAAYKIGLTPNKISLIGFILAILSAITYTLVPCGSWLLLLATSLLLGSGFCDILDGIVARSFQQITVFGGILDSVLDRYADVTIFAAIIIAGLCNLIWGLIAMSGSILVSYSRARIESAGIKMESVGFAERAERMLVLAAVTIIAFWWPPILNYGIVLLAIISNLTVVQRILYVYKALKIKN